MTNWCKVEGVLTLRDVSQQRGESTTVGARVEELHLPKSRLISGDYVLFVHGYNVSQLKARESYARFRWWLEEFKARSHVLEVHWPGDRKWGKFSAAAYPFKIGTARRCGRLLAEWIADRAEGCKLTLIGHSLGCRVVLETIENLREIAQVRQQPLISRIANVCLMAAAAPVSYIMASQLGPRAGEEIRWHILYSRGDWVLRIAFRLGQLAGFDPGHAIGLHGHPTAIWKTNRWELYQPRNSVENAKFYDHGYYWQGGPEERVCEERCYWKRFLSPLPAIEPDNEGLSAELVASMLGARVDRPLPIAQKPPPRTLRERALDAVRAIVW